MAVPAVRVASAILALLLSGCEARPAAEPSATAGLESAAIERGLIRDPGDRSLTGLYAGAADRICIVERGGGARVGIDHDDGDGAGCAASGIVRRSGDRLAMTLGAGGDCRFDAAYDGAAIRFPGRLPDGCARFCSRQASFAGLAAERLSDSEAEATALRDRRGRPLCAVGE